MKPGRTSIIGLAALSILSVFLSTALIAPLMAQEDPQRQDLENLRKAIEKKGTQERQLTDEANRLKSEASSLQQRLVILAAKTQTQEAKANRIEQNLDGLIDAEAVLAKAINAERRQQSQTLTALTRISREPPASIVLRVARPVDAARTAMLLRAALPVLEVRAQNIGEELNALKTVRLEIETERNGLTQTLEELAGLRIELDALMNEKWIRRRTAMDQAEQAREEMTALSKNAKSMEAFLRSIEKREAKRRALALKPADDTVVTSLSPTTQTPQSPNILPVARGSLSLPARGRTLTAYGQNDGIGGKTKGITLRTRQRAQVVAPYDGEILFAGPFKGYGQVLIMSIGQGYHVLLAGLTRIDGIVGQKLLRGEPIGQMGASVQTSELYIEIRDKGRPVNPSPWIAYGDVSGAG